MSGDFSHFYPRVHPLALAVFCCAFAAPGFALVITDTGAIGADGRSGLIGARGAAGGSSQAVVASPDPTNIATAIGGAGGRGGRSLLPIAPGGRGGDGGGAVAEVNSDRFQVYADALIGTASASGGAGGDGGDGVILGNGGRGGAAKARLADSSGADDGISSLLSLSSAVGGKGGYGLQGGAGGAADATLDGRSGNIFDNRSIVTSTGGDGGAGVLRGGDGGTAWAQGTVGTGGQPTEPSAAIEAHGGDGGSAGSGVNGNGGDAHAEAQGSFSSRGGGLSVNALARGGTSGTGSLLGFAGGEGGDATALASAEGSPGTSAGSVAIAGAGASYGGDALAVAHNRAAISGGASAVAQGGAGPKAGAALATAVASGDAVVTTSNARAVYAGPFARSLSVVAGDTPDSNFVPSTFVTQAGAGDTRSLQDETPDYDHENALTLVRGSIAPSPQEIADELADSNGDGIAAAFAGGVWGLGEAETHGDLREPNSLILSYQFDITDYADPGHLWLGLTYANFNADSFVIQGDGTTLFNGIDHPGVFGDTLFDLGSWVDLVGSDGLFEVDFRFENFVGEIHFAFANISDGTQQVPEPAPLLLLLSGLGLLWLWRMEWAVSRYITSLAPTNSSMPARAGRR